MAIELGAAYLSILPETSKIAPGVNKALSGSEVTRVANNAGRGIGSRMSGAIGGALKTGATGVVAAGSTALGVALTKGFQRLNALDQAKAKLTGLGHSTKSVSDIMANALASVDKTAFGMGEAATTAAGAVAAGVKPGKDLERTLKLVADAATIGGTSMSEMGSIFNKVATSNKVQGDVINQLGDKGIPIVQLMAKELGLTAEETVKLASQGKINFDIFRNAIEHGMGGAALASGKTFQGALDNLFAALGRVGAKLTGGVFAKLPAFLTAVTTALKPVEGSAESLGNVIAARVNPVLEKLTVLLSTGGGGIGDVFRKMPQVLGPATGAFLALGTSGLAPLLRMVPGLGGLASGLGLLGGPVGIAAAAFAGLAASSPELRAALSNLMSALGDAGKALLPALTELGKVVLPIVVNAIGALTTGLSAAINWLAQAVRWIAGQGSLTDAFTQLQGSIDVGAVMSSLGTSFSQLGESLAGLAPALASFGAVLPQLASVGVDLLARGLQFLADNMDTIVQFLPAIIAGFLAWKAATAAASVATFRLQSAQVAMAPVNLANNIMRTIAITLEYRYAKAMGTTVAAKARANVAENIGLATRIRATAATVAAAIAQRAVTIAMGIATAAQWAWNLAMSANPIGIIIVAIGALVAALVWLWNNNEDFRNGVMAAWAGIKAAALTVADWFMKTLVPGIQWVWAQISGFFERGWAALAGGIQHFIQVNSLAWQMITNTIRSAWQNVTNIFTGVITWITSVFSAAWGRIVSVFGPPLDAVRKIVQVFAAVTVRGFQTIAGWVLGAFASNWARIRTIFIVPLQSALAAIFGANGIIEKIKAAIWTAFTWARDSFQKAWAIIGNIFVKPLITAYRAIFGSAGIIESIKRAIWSAFTWARDSFARAWNAVTRFVTAPLWAAYNTIAGPRGVIAYIRAAINGAWTWVRDSFRIAWNGLTKIVTDPIWAAYRALAGEKGALAYIRSAFDGAVRTIGAAWDKIRAKLGEPIKFAIEKIINPLINGFNDVAVKVGLPGNKLSPFPVPQFRDGGWTGSLGRTAVAGVVHGREFVMDAATTARAGGAAAMESIRGAIRAGWKPAGYASGGYVNPVPGGSHRHTGYPWATWAGDFPVPLGTPIKAWKDGVVAAVRRLNYSYGLHVRLNHTDGSSSLYAHMSRIIADRVGEMVKAGQIIGLTGSTGNSTGPHLHFETMRGAYRGGSAATESGGGSGAGFDPLGMLRDAIAGPMKLVGQIGSSPWAQMIGKLPGMLKEGLEKKATGFLGMIGDAASKGFDTLKTGAGYGAMLPFAIQALTFAKQPLSLLPLMMHRAQVESGFNPFAVNNWDINAKHGDPSKGVMQVIKSTFDAYAGPFRPLGQFNPLASFYAAIMYTNARYRGNFQRAWAGTQGYATGTRSAAAGYNWTAEKGAELVVGPQMRQYSGREMVFNAAQTRSLLTGRGEGVSAGRQQVVVNVIDRDGSFVERMRGEIDRHDQFNDLAVRGVLGAFG